jgi:hypothetical protein
VQLVRTWIAFFVSERSTLTDCIMGPTGCLGIACLLIGILPVALNSQQPRAGESPILDIPGTSPTGEIMFEQAAGATRLSNGGIVVADRTGGSVRFFDETGRVVHIAGRSGRGPGEFQLISWLGQCSPDTVFAFDFLLQRMSVIDRDGEIVRQYQVSTTSTPGAPPAVINCSRTGTFAMLGRPYKREAPPLRSRFVRAPGVLVLADANGRVTRTLGMVPVTDMDTDGGGWAPRPMGRLTSLAVTADRVYAGTADSAFVTVLTHQGMPLRSLAVGVPQREVTPRHIERAVDAYAVYMSPGPAREAVKRAFMKEPMPAFLPPYRALYTDPDDRLWVLISAPGDSTTMLRAISRDGAIIGDVQLSADATVFEVGRHHILAGVEDEDGEPHVMMYRLSGMPR